MKKTMFGCLVIGMAASAAGCATEVPGTGAGDPQTDETSQALSSKEFDYEYYSDATYTVQVGQYFQSCTGLPSLSGTRTRYIIGSQTTCRTNLTVGCWENFDSRSVCSYDTCVNCF